MLLPLESTSRVNCFTDGLMAIQPSDDPEIVEIDNYVSTDANFQPNKWAQSSASCKRTTNSCESFLSKLNCSSKHDLLLVVLLGFQIEVYIKCRNPTTSKQTKKIVDKIRQQMAELANGNNTRIDFVKIISFKYLPAQ